MNLFQLVNYATIFFFVSLICLFSNVAVIKTGRGQLRIQRSGSEERIWRWTWHICARDPTLQCSRTVSYNLFSCLFSGYCLVDSISVKMKTYKTNQRCHNGCKAPEAMLDEVPFYSKLNLLGVWGYNVVWKIDP